MDIPATLQQIRPGAEWTLRGETLDGLEWVGPGDAPTEAELEAGWLAVLAAREQAAADKEAARLSARARLTAQGFTDAEIDVMYPTLVAAS